jgi:spore maturation protein CgeB
MSFRLFSISSMYKGYLDSFYHKHIDVSGLSYLEHKKLLLDDTTEFVAAYLKNFQKIGIETDCAICNDIHLQKKWSKERNLDQYNDWKVLFDQIKTFGPDVLWIENLGYVTSGFLRHVRQQIPSIRLIAANHCSPLNSRVLESLGEVDFVITCTPGLKTSIENLGRKSYLVYHGFDSDLLRRTNVEKIAPLNDFIFSGSLITGGDFHTQRIRLIERILEEKISIGLYVNLEKEYRIKVKQSIYLFSKFINKIGFEKSFERFQILKYGKTWVESYSDTLLKHVKPPVFGIDMLELFINSKIVLNFHIGIAGDYAGNMRMFEVTGVGSCLLTDNKKNMPELFNIDSEVVVYDSVQDCVAKVKWLLEHEDQRKEIAMAGQKKTLQYHTVENRCKAIFEIMDHNILNPAIK